MYNTIDLSQPSFSIYINKKDQIYTFKKFIDFLTKKKKNKRED